MTEPATSAPLPGLSMVVTCYRLEKFIRQNLESCFAQKYAGPMEVVIVDDCSPDNSVAEIERAVADFGAGWDVTIVRNEKNLGVSGATDAGWAAAKYDWFVMVDGDDIQLPERCARTADIIARHPEVDMISLSARDMSMDGTLRETFTAYSRKPYEQLPEELLLMTPEERMGNHFGTGDTPAFAVYGCGMAVSRRLYERWGAAQPDASVRAGIQDSIWQWRAMMSSPVIGSKQLACLYRSHGANLVNRTRQKGWQGRLEAERFGCHYCQVDSLSLRSMLRDVRRALHESGLSNWPKDELARAEARLAVAYESNSLKGDWWYKPWRERLRRTMSTRKFRRWTWPRLLPLPLFCLLSWCFPPKKG